MSDSKLNGMWFMNECEGKYPQVIAILRTLSAGVLLVRNLVSVLSNKIEKESYEHFRKENSK